MRITICKYIYFKINTRFNMLNKNIKCLEYYRNTFYELTLYN